MVTTVMANKAKTQRRTLMALRCGKPKQQRAIKLLQQLQFGLVDEEEEDEEKPVIVGELEEELEPEAVALLEEGNKGCREYWLLLYSDELEEFKEDEGVVVEACVVWGGGCWWWEWWFCWELLYKFVEFMGLDDVKLFVLLLLLLCTLLTSS